MERLTEEKQLGPFASLKDKAESVPGAFNTYECFYAHEVAVTRLKQYEDTGLEPKEIEEVQEALTPIPFGRFREIMEAERDGRLAVLPCKLRDEVYYIPRFNGKAVGGIQVGHIQMIGFTTAGTRMKIREYHDHNRDFMLGKNVFLTREEAEAALKEVE